MTQSQEQSDRGPWLKTLFLSLAVLLVALSAATGISCWRFMTAWQDVTPEQLLEQTQQEGDLEAVLAQDREVAEGVKQKNFYAPPPPKRNPVTQVNGIFASGEALINGQWYKAGDSIGEAKLLEVCAPTHVVIEWQGNKTTLGPMGAPDSGPENRSRSKSSRPSRNRPDRAAVAPHAVAKESPGPRRRPSPEEIEKARNMPREERKAYLETLMSRDKRD